MGAKGPAHACEQVLERFKISGLVNIDSAKIKSCVCALDMCRWLKERMKARRVLLSCDGPYDSVIKLKPPMCFGSAEVDMLMAHLRCVCGWVHYGGNAV